MSMDAGELALAAVPPAFAIMIELFTPFNSTYFKRQAGQIVTSHLPPPVSGASAAAVSSRESNETTTTLLQNSMAGTAAVSGLWPTIISFAVGFAAIYNNVATPFWWLFGMIVGLLGICLFVTWVLSKNNTLQLATIRVGITPWVPATYFSALIYLTNIVMIGGALAIFKGWVT